MRPPDRSTPFDRPGTAQPGSGRHESLAAGCGVEITRRWPVMPECYQVLGERCSGTNFLDALIARNTRLRRVGIFAWKHGFPVARMIPRNMVVFVSFRHPHAWLRSMYRKPWHAAEQVKSLGFSDFIRAPWITEVDEDILRDDVRDLHAFEGLGRFLVTYLWNHRAKRGEAGRLVNRLGLGYLPQSEKARDILLGTVLQTDRHPITGEPFANILQLRSAKARAALGLRQRGCNLVLVNHEFAGADPERFLDRIAARFELARRRRYRPVTRRMGRYQEEESGQRHSGEAALDRDELDFIWNQLDREVEAEIGYRRDRDPCFARASPADPRPA